MKFIAVVRYTMLPKTKSWLFSFFLGEDVELVWSYLYDNFISTLDKYSPFHKFRVKN